jgi:hypothetical protein
MKKKVLAGVHTNFERHGHTEMYLLALKTQDED